MGLFFLGGGGAVGAGYFCAIFEEITVILGFFWGWGWGGRWGLDIAVQFEWVNFFHSISLIS